MTQGQRKFLLSAHIMSSVGWLGAVLTFLALAATALFSDNFQTVRSVLIVMEPMVVLVIVPLAFMSLITGVLQGLATPWGLFQHYWVVVKLALTVTATIILLLYMPTITSIAAVAAASAEPSRSLAASPTLHASLGLLALLATTVLSVFKPKGLTPYGQKKQRERRNEAEA